MPEPLIQLRGVVSAVGGFPVLAGIDLTVEPGETLLVAGSNGAGKTSLLKLVAGLIPVTAGTAIVLGNDLTVDRRSHRHRLAFVGSETFSYDDLTVRTNLDLHAHIGGVDPRRVDVVVDLLGLADLMGVLHGRLSTGQRRRCALALAMLRDVELLLLDEPHSGLDSATRDVVDETLTVVRRAGRTVVIASHELDRVGALADRQVVVESGCLLLK